VGWHVPTDTEWTVLTEYLGGDAIAGGKMKTTGTVEAITGLWYDPNTEATNSSGFSAVPGGLRSFNGPYNIGIGVNSYWWSSSVDVTNEARSRYLNYDFSFANSISGLNQYGFSVRCLRD
jgi:uncharacterized protein (TIGR02145 family)